MLLVGGIEHVRAVVVDDSLGLGAELESAMETYAGNYQEEWTAMLADPQKLRRVRSFVNAPGQSDEQLAYAAERGQHRPAGPVRPGAAIGIGAPS